MGELSLWVGEGRSKGVYRATRPDSAGRSVPEGSSTRIAHSASRVAASQYSLLSTALDKSLAKTAS